MSHQNLGASLRGRGNRAEAEDNFEQAVRVFRDLAADFPRAPEYRRRLGWSLVSLGNAKRGRGAWAAAVRHYRDALAVQQKLAAAYPAVADYQDDQADSHWGLAFALKRLDRRGEAETE